MLASGCASERSGDGAEVEPGTGASVDYCSLPKLPVETVDERAAALREVERMFKSGQPFPSVEVGKAATQFGTALQGDGRAPTKAEAAAGFLAVPEARDRLRAACE